MIAVLHPRAHTQHSFCVGSICASRNMRCFMDYRRRGAFHDIRLLLALGPVPRALLDLQPKLEIVQTMSAGYETVDVDAASELGIWVSNAPAGLTGNAVSVAEFAVMLLIGASRHLKSALRSEVDSTSAVGTDARSLRGKTLCVVGLGSIGRSLVELLRPFGLKIVATDRDVSQPPEGVTLYAAAELNAAVADVDYVVICVQAARITRN